MKQLPLCHQTMSLCPKEEQYLSFNEGVYYFFIIDRKMPGP